VRFLPAQALWAYLVEDPFWKAAKRDDAGFERAKSMVAFMLDRALKDNLVSHQEVVEGIRVDKLAQLMPRPELEIALDAALAAGRRGQPFSDGNLIAELGTKTLAAYIPLSHIWDEVIHPCIASDHGLVAANQNQDVAAVVDSAEAAIDALGDATTHVGMPPPAEVQSATDAAKENVQASKSKSNRAAKKGGKTAQAGSAVDTPAATTNPRMPRPGAPPPPPSRPAVTNPPRLPERRSQRVAGAEDANDFEVVDIDLSADAG